MATTSSRQLTRGFHGLIVDDAVMDGFIASCLLRHEGYEVTIAKSGLEAVEAVTKTKFDFVLMDMRMPGMDGFEATRHIRQLEGLNGQVPIMALTAMDFREQEPRFLTAGMDGVMSKPITPDVLRVALSRVKKIKPEAAGQLEVTDKTLSHDQKMMPVQPCVERYKSINLLEEELALSQPTFAAFSMEEAFWMALSKICSAGKITPDQFIVYSKQRHLEMSQESAVRLEVVNYFRQVS